MVLTDHVNSEVYDAHEAFEIDKTKMKDENVGSIRYE